MNKFEEYKKLRKQGYKAAMAKRQVDRDKPVFVYKTDEMRHKPLEIRKNGFVFYFSLHTDEDCILLRDLGHFTDTYEEGAFAHDHHNNRTYNWFVPANFTEAEWFAQQGMSRSDAHLASHKEAKQQYELARSYGDDWEYYDLHGKVYLDQPELSDILLAENWLGGMDVHYDRMDEVNTEWISEIIDEQISELLPEAFKRLTELHKAICGLTITTKKVHEKRVEELAEELENFAATFLTMGIGYEITEAAIKKWAEQTMQLGAEDLGEDLDLIPSGRMMPDWLDEVAKRAADLADYYQSRHLSECRHKCPM